MILNLNCAAGITEIGVGIDVEHLATFDSESDSDPDPESRKNYNFYYTTGTQKDQDICNPGEFVALSDDGQT